MDFLDDVRVKFIRYYYSRYCYFIYSVSLARVLVKKDALVSGQFKKSYFSRFGGTLYKVY